jgi:hypothetical protein
VASAIVVPSSSSHLHTVCPQFLAMINSVDFLVLQPAKTRENSWWTPRHWCHGWSNMSTSLDLCEHRIVRVTLNIWNACLPRLNLTMTTVGICIRIILVQDNMTLWLRSFPPGQIPNRQQNVVSFGDSVSFSWAWPFKYISAPAVSKNRGDPQIRARLGAQVYLAQIRARVHRHIFGPN